MDLQIKLGENLFNKGQFKEAFLVFKKIASDRNRSTKERADAYNMMGAIIIGPAPYLASQNEFEESINYFKKALSLDANNLGALLNIIGSFETCYGVYYDTEVLKFAYQKIMGQKDKLSDTDLKMIKEKYKLIS